MPDAINPAPIGVARWIKVEDLPAPRPDQEARCTCEVLQGVVAKLGNFEVVSTAPITSGRYEAAPPPFLVNGVAFPAVTVEDLPDFWEVRIVSRGPRHVTTITVWAPRRWNGRFLGTFGGGNRTDSIFGVPESMRGVGLSTAVRNGFAAAKTDGGNRDPRFADWGLIEGTNEIDWELTKNWIDRSTHEMTVVGKAITEAIYGEPPRYSYAAGCSGGGRQALVEAQRYPGDYHGIWSSDPAINWTKFIPGELWPALVMKELGAPLAPDKMDAFRVAAIDACDGVDGLRDGIVGAFDPCTFDARTLVGQDTPAGVITETDAAAMNKIWEGPRTADGDFLWYGLRPGSESWGRSPLSGGLCSVAEVDGKLEPQPFEIATSYIKSWLVRDAAWDWKTLTFDGFEALFEQSVREMADCAADEADLSAFAAAGGKLILSHGANDQLIPAEGSIDYYRRVIDETGSEEDVKTFARLFVSEGDGHAHSNMPGPGLTPAEAMTALMQWVEAGIAPEEITCSTVDLPTGAVIATRPVYAYPMVPEYRGQGDPDHKASFAPTHYAKRAGSLVDG